MNSDAVHTACALAAIGKPYRAIGTLNAEWERWIESNGVIQFHVVTDIIIKRVFSRLVRGSSDIDVVIRVTVSGTVREGDDRIYQSFFDLRGIAFVNLPSMS